MLTTKRTHITVLAGALGSMLVLGSCGAGPIATAAPSPSPSEQVPAVIAPLMSWLQFHTLGCGVSVDVGAGVRQWTCAHDAGLAPGVDKTVLRVVVRASTTGLKEILAEVDQSLDKAASIDQVQGFLADTVGASPPTGSVGPAISQWVVANVRTGGHTSLGGFIVDLDPFGAISTLRLRPGGPQ